MKRKTTVNRILRIMLTLFGIWPGMSHVAILRIYWFFAIGSDEIWLCRYLLVHFQSSDLNVLMDCFSSCLAHMKIIVKLVFFWLNQRKFVKVLTIMMEDWDDCANSDVNMRETACKAKVANRITNGICILHLVTIVGYSIGALTAPVVITNNKTELPLLLKLQLPIDFPTRRAYHLFVSAQFVHLVMIANIMGLINALLLTLILHAAGQMDILCYWLTELVPKKGEQMRESFVVAADRIVRKHKKIIIFTEYIEDLYTYIALVQFTLNTVLMCSLAFLIVTAIGTPEATEKIGRSILFYTITNLEAFIFCYAGEYLKNKSKAIGTAAYNTAWYELRPENSRTLIFIILRAQKQLTLTVGKIMDLSLESFTNIMKASGSYLSMLLAMQ